MSARRFSSLLMRRHTSWPPLPLPARPVKNQLRSAAKRTMPFGLRQALLIGGGEQLLADAGAIEAARGHDAVARVFGTQPFDDPRRVGVAPLAVVDKDQREPGVRPRVTGVLRRRFRQLQAAAAIGVESRQPGDQPAWNDSAATP